MAKKPPMRHSGYRNPMFIGARRCSSRLFDGKADDRRGLGLDRNAVGAMAGSAGLRFRLDLGLGSVLKHPNKMQGGDERQNRRHY